MQSDQKTQFSSRMKRFLLNGNFQKFLMFQSLDWKYLQVLIVQNNGKNEFYGLIRTLLSGYDLPYGIFKLYIPLQTFGIEFQ
jgi:hypothetical protein